MAEGLPGQVMENNTSMTPTASGANLSVDKLADNVKQWFTERNSQTLTRALAFVPFILQQSYFEGKRACFEGDLNDKNDKKVAVHKGVGCVMFCEAGLTTVTEKLAQSTDGAEEFSKCLLSFYTPMIDLINAYRGDTIKFSDNALTIYFPCADDTKHADFDPVIPPHGSYGLPDLGPMVTSVLRACACCIEIHRRLSSFDTGSDGVRFSLRIGVGCGEIRILQVGGRTPPDTHVPRMEYLITGTPLQQITMAQSLANKGETCLSPDAWALVSDCVIEGRQLEMRREYHVLLRIDESKYTFPTIKYAAQLYDARTDNNFRISELNIIRRYIPSSVFKQIECDTLQYVNEMRKVSVIFISATGLDVMSETMPHQAQKLMSSVQKVCYAHEGTLNKFLIDDKGPIFLLVFGLPPLVHPDDSTRAVLCCIELVEVFRHLRLAGSFGVTTGRSYCGACGSAKRMEYTVLGDTVNLAAALMVNAAPLSILCDEETSKHTTGEVVYKPLPPIEVKHRSNKVPIFRPQLKDASAHVGLTLDRKIWFPWYDHPLDGSAVMAKDVVSSCKARVMQLCGVNRWAGIMKVQEMLGGGFNRTIHRAEQTIPTTAPRAKAPAGSPFAEGGIVVIEADTGLGKIELAEHIVTHCSTQFQMMPVFGSMGPRPGQSTRMAIELLRSTVAIFRHLGGVQGGAGVPQDDAQALDQVVPQHLKGSVPLLRDLLKGQANAKLSSEIFETAIKVIIALIVMLKKQTPVLVVLLFEHGTRLFDKTTAHDETVFWKMTADLVELVRREKSIAGLILCRNADRNNLAVKQAKDTNAFVALKGLSEENIVEYMSSYLHIPEPTIPPQLRLFVSQVTLGNPLYIRETLDQLVEDQHLTLKPGTSITLKAGTLDKVDIASWNHTAMVGCTVCRLESLDPIQAAALKMSTCFEGTFTLPDLAASNCSRWGGATHFDLLRLFSATSKLVDMGIIELVDPPSAKCQDNSDHTPPDRHSRATRHFRMRSMLDRTVGAALMLEAKKKSVKRNALIDRVLQNELPGRMTKLAAKKSAQHIPWYYERALRRMQQLH